MDPETIAEGVERLLAVLKRTGGMLTIGDLKEQHGVVVIAMTRAWRDGTVKIVGERDVLEDSSGRESSFTETSVVFLPSVSTEVAAEYFVARKEAKKTPPSATPRSESAPRPKEKSVRMYDAHRLQQLKAALHGSKP